MRRGAPIGCGKLREGISEGFAPIIRIRMFSKNNGISECIAPQEEANPKAGLRAGL